MQHRVASSLCVDAGCAICPHALSGLRWYSCKLFSHICRLLERVYGWKPTEITLMTDTPGSLTPWPTKANIQKAIDDLVVSALPGGALTHAATGRLFTAFYHSRLGAALLHMPLLAWPCSHGALAPPVLRTAASEGLFNALMVPWPNAGPNAPALAPPML